jgi:hypothetical protein
MFAWMVGILSFAPFLARDAGALQLGVGANYWKSVDDVDDDDFDEDGLSWLATIQFPLAAIAKLEANVEWFEEGFGGSTEDVYAPQAVFILGGLIYAGVGIGVYYFDDEFADDPFYTLRAGLDLELLPSVHLDINANYRFENWDQVNDEDIDEDTITLGAAIRLEI